MTYTFGPTYWHRRAVRAATAAERHDAIRLYLLATTLRATADSIVDVRPPGMRR